MGTQVLTAMIIDDDEDLGIILAMILESRKIRAMTVHSLSEAEEYLHFMKPTVIFLDNSFPEGLGINFIRTIKSADDEIKIIMITADTDKWIEEKAMDEGINYFLQKPITRNNIDVALDKLNVKRS
jgi:two-component system response regulator MtrA